MDGFRKAATHSCALGHGKDGDDSGPVSVILASKDLPASQRPRLHAEEFQRPNQSREVFFPIECEVIIMSGFLR